MGRRSISPILDVYGHPAEPVIINPYIFGGAADPLAGVPDIAFRFQTHNGDGVPMGMFQDTACTTPATADGDVVKGIKSFDGATILATQGTTGNAPLLKIVSGIPVLRTDGSNDFMMASTPYISNTTTYSIYYCGTVVAGGIMFAEDNNTGGRGWVVSFNNFELRGTSGYGYTFGSGRHYLSIIGDTGAAGRTYVDGTVSGTTIGDSTVNTHTGVLNIGRREYSGAESYGSCDIISIILATSSHSSGNRGTVETYLGTLD